MGASLLPPAAALAAEPTGAATGVWVGAALVLVALALVPVCAQLARWLDPGRRVFFARWGFSHLLLVMLVFLGAQVLVAGLLPLPEDGGDGLGLLLRATLGLGPVALVCAALARRTEPEPLRALGLEPRGLARGALCGAVCYLLLLPGLVGLALLWPHVLELVGHRFRTQDVLQRILDLEGPALALALVLAVGVVPFLEELLFRGFIQPLFVQNLRERAGVALTSLLFAALHGPSAAGPVFGLSLVLGALMLRSGRLWAPWCAHALHNGLVLGLLLWVPGARDVLLGT